MDCGKGDVCSHRKNPVMPGCGTFIRPLLLDFLKSLRQAFHEELTRNTGLEAKGQKPISNALAQSTIIALSD
jgi:hypothetical protein